MGNKVSGLIFRYRLDTMGVGHTISSSQIGQTSLALAAPPVEGAPILILDTRSCGPKSGAGLEEGGEMDRCEFEYWDTELASEGA